MQCIPTLLVLLAALHSLAFLFGMNNNASSSSLWIEETTPIETHSSCFLIFRYVIVQSVIHEICQSRKNYPNATLDKDICRLKLNSTAGKITLMHLWIFVGKVEKHRRTFSWQRDCDRTKRFFAKPASFLISFVLFNGWACFTNDKIQNFKNGSICKKLERNMM